MVDQVGSHVADRADAPVHPAAPVERMVDGVVLHQRRRAEKQVPRELVGHRVRRSVHRCREPLHHAAEIPAHLVRGRLRRRGTRDALRPVRERTVGPDVDFAHVANRARSDVLVHQARVVGRVALIAHLRHDLRVDRLLRQRATLLHRPRQGLLDVDVLAEAHRCRRDHGVGVIGRRDQHRVDVLLLLQHLAVVDVARRLTGLVAQRLHAGELGLRAGALPCRHRARLGQALLGRGRLLREAVERTAGVAPVHVAERHDVLAGEAGQVRPPHATHADTGHVDEIARWCLPLAEDVAGNDGQPGRRHRGAAHELATREARVLVRGLAGLIHGNDDSSAWRSEQPTTRDDRLPSAGLHQPAISHQASGIRHYFRGFIPGEFHLMTW